MHKRPDKIYERNTQAISLIRRWTSEAAALARTSTPHLSFSFGERRSWYKCRTFGDPTKSRGKGKVENVGTHAVQLSELSGMEFFDATVKLDEVAAVIVKVRTK